MSNRVICIIPARYGSTRLPGKPLLEINGLPLVMWAYRSAERANVFDRILVATDDARIADAVQHHGGIAAMTSAGHSRGTDRVYEAAKNEEYDYIVNIQGDEPDFPAKALTDFAEHCTALDDKTLLTLASHATIKEIENHSAVKVVCDARGYALYFSRSVIPYDRDRAIESPDFLKHKGIYGFSREGLRRYCRCLVRDFESVGIDTPEDLAAFRARYERTH
jgi:3-deoxy-manno-octulosonate cytidylyltransferase (CMP-KDO synthetase)